MTAIKRTPAMVITKDDREMVAICLHQTAAEFDKLADSARYFGQGAVELKYSERAKRARQLAAWLAKAKFQENSDAD